MPSDFQSDIDAILQIDAVPTILDVVCRTTGMGFAAISRVTDERWITCVSKDDIDFGLVPGGELKVETTICREILDHRQAVVIDHVAEDETYRGHPTPAMYGFQSYISMPIILRDGRFFGTLCAIDTRPAQLKNPETIGMFRMFADLIAFHLEARDRLQQSEASLVEERATAGLREQFIAVLGHDLRNPLSAVASGLRLMRGHPERAQSDRLLALMQGSVDRMAALINDVLDLARGRQGGGIIVGREPVDLAPVLAHVVDELQTTHLDQRIDVEIVLPKKIRCDQARIAQLLSNLLGNALSHGAASRPVEVQAVQTADAFRLTITNSGAAILPTVLDRLFEPFVRGGQSNGAGLGLGLYIASEIARAHGGTLQATSDDVSTCFIFTMPLGKLPAH